MELWPFGVHRILAFGVWDFWGLKGLGLQGLRGPGLSGLGVEVIALIGKSSQSRILLALSALVRIAAAFLFAESISDIMRIDAASTLEAFICYSRYC